MRCKYIYPDGFRCNREVGLVPDKRKESTHSFDKDINQTNGTWAYPSKRDPSGMCKQHAAGLLKRRDKEKEKKILSQSCFGHNSL